MCRTTSSYSSNFLFPPQAAQLREGFKKKSCNIVTTPVHIPTYPYWCTECNFLNFFGYFKMMFKSLLESDFFFKFVFIQPTVIFESDCWLKSSDLMSKINKLIINNQGGPSKNKMNVAGTCKVSNHHLSPPPPLTKKFLCRFWWIGTMKKIHKSGLTTHPST